MNNITTGKRGELIAAEYLKKQGYKIIETNKHFSKFCEIDIIALDKNTLVFAEVKTRKNNQFGTPFEAITKTKYNHIKTGVFTYLSENKKYKNYRIDAIGIILEPELKIEHLKNI